MIQETFPIDGFGIMESVFAAKNRDLYSTILQHPKTSNAFIKFNNQNTPNLDKNIFNLITKLPKVEQSTYLSKLIDLMNSLPGEDDCVLINLNNINNILESFDKTKQNWLTHLLLESPPFAKKWLTAKKDSSKERTLDITVMDEFIRNLPSYAFKTQDASSEALIDLFDLIMENTPLLDEYKFRTKQLEDRLQQASISYTEGFNSWFPLLDLPPDIMLAIQLFKTNEPNEINDKQYIELYRQLISTFMEVMEKDDHCIQTTDDYDRISSHIFTIFSLDSPQANQKRDILKKVYTDVIKEAEIDAAEAELAELEATLEATLKAGIEAAAARVTAPAAV